jgi:PAS domain S-box-containing protein
LGTSGSPLTEIAKLNPGDHLCCIYETEEEHRTVLTPYLRQGLERNEKVVYIVDARTAETVLEYLRRGDGLDTRPFLDKGQFVILPVAESYMRDGMFDPERMISLLRHETDSAISEGYKALRVTGEMSWALKGLPGSERLIEYESKLNDFFPGTGCIGLCQYDRRRFPPELLLQVLATHPIAVIGTEVYENFHFVPPENFLASDYSTAILGHWIDLLRTRILAKAEEDRIRESESMYRHLVRTATDAIFVMQDEVIRFSHPTTERITGYTSEELANMSFLDLVHPEDREMVKGKHPRRPDGTDIPGIYSFRLRNKAGEELWCQLSAALIDWGGRPATLNFLRDISEQKKLESQLFVSQKMEAVGRLAGGVAHDFNNLLTAIIGYSDLALGRIDGQDPISKDIGEIQKASKRCAILTRQFLAFSRKQIALPKVINLNDVVAEMDSLLRRLIGEDIRLVSVPGKDLGNVKADPGQIEQVIANLVVNSRDAMLQGGNLTIETANVELDDLFAQGHENVSPGSCVMLAVSDTGCGMDEETLAKIFEPFFTTKEAGTGLGLATTHGIVKQSGGDIRVYSEPGLGTTFKIYFPRVQGAVTAVSEPSAIPLEKLRGSETILLVEDEENVRQLVRKVLVQYGYNVLDMRCGNEAVDACSRYRDTIHLMLTDVVLPDINGVELSKRLAPMRPEMKVLFMSGYTSNAIMREEALKNHDMFIQKPFTVVSLTCKIRKLLDSKSTEH